MLKFYSYLITSKSYVLFILFEHLNANGVLLLFTENDTEVKQKLDLGGKFNADEKKVPASLNMVPGSGLREQHSSPRKAWVCCDDCHKWRHIPASLADLIEETKCAWYVIYTWKNCQFTL